LLSWLEKLDRVAIRVLQQDLPATRSGFHLIAKMKSRAFQTFDPRWKVGHFKDDPIPSARLLPKSAGHWPRTGRAWAAEDKLEMPSRNLREGGRPLVVKRKA
jgi:hypothetical protein